MAKHKRLISIVTSVLMLVTMTGASAFATEQNADLDAQGSPASVEDQVAPEDVEMTEEVLPEDGAVLNEGETTVTESALTIDPITAKAYTGEAIQPKPVVKDGDTELIEGTDYTVSYENNVYVSSKWPKVVVTGIGTYEGLTANATFTIKAPTVAKVTGLKAVAGFNAIKLKWNKVEGADTYLIMRNDKKKAKGWPRDLSVIRAYSSNGKMKESVAKKPFWENVNKGTVNKYKTYKYYVYAVKKYKVADAKDPTKYTVKKAKSTAKTIKKKCCSKLRIRCTIKSGTTLTSTNGKKHFKIKRGQKIMTDGYGGGKYYFKKKGVYFRILNARAKNRKAYYDKKYDYTEEEAEYFINNKNLKYARPGSTKKKYLIWASTYTQHVYVFKKVGSRWELHKDWDCSTGAATAPSPTGNCKIHKRILHRHHITYWNCFSTLNALHGIKPIRYAGYDWTKHLGEIMSNGCIRNANQNAEWIWKNCPIGTKVLVF